MGQCMSRKAAGAFAASAAGAHSRPSKKKHSKLRESPDDDPKPNNAMKKNGTVTSKGVASSFGFKRRPLTAPSALTTQNQAVGRRLAFTDSADTNGNNKDTKSLTANIHTNGRSTPRLPPPKKEGNATQGVGRFGFRQTNLQVNRSNRVADLNAAQLGLPKGSSTPRAFLTSTNYASQNKFTHRDAASRTTTNAVDKNRNRSAAVKTTAQSELIGRFTFQTNQLPRPQPIRVMNTKTAKTIANNNMKFAASATRRSPEDGGTLTEDSGLGSHVGMDMDNNCPLTPLNGRRHRNLQVMVNGSTFELKEPDVPIPKLPSSGGAHPERSSFQTTGLVRERTFAYEQQIGNEIKRKISVTSSEGFSDEPCQKEIPQHKPLLLKQKSFLKPKPSPIKSFLKTKVIEQKDYSSASSEDIEYGLGGEALADELSVSISSSDESKDKEMNKLDLKNLGNVSRILTEDKGFLKKSLETLASKQEFRPVTLTIANSMLSAEDDESNTLVMLEDETSPVDDSLLSFTESDETSKKKDNSSESKEINEKPSPSTPGTPSNASNGSNSFTIPDDKDFLIDDEIADQPALLGDRSQMSESTLIDNATPLRRRKVKSIDKFSTQGSNVSLDTLSPCDSIGSDDLMMDFDYSQSSMDEDKLGKISSRKSLNTEETVNTVNSLETDIKNNEELRDWSALFNGTNDKITRGVAPSRPRFVRSRTGTPNSVGESSSSLDGRSNGRISTPSGSLRRFFAQTSNHGDESDDSISRFEGPRGRAALKKELAEVKAMLFQLRDILFEQAIEDELLKSETRNPFEEVTNGQSNGLPEHSGYLNGASNDSDRFDMDDLRRQILFLQGQLEDKEKTVISLQEEMTKICTDNYLSNSAPASTVSREMSNKATQTDRIRRLSTEPSLTTCSQLEATQGNLVSAIESSSLNHHLSTPTAVSTKEPSMSPTYQRTSNSKSHTMIPRRSESRSRVVPSSST